MKASITRVLFTGTFLGGMAMPLLLAGCGSENQSTTSSSVEQAQPPAADSIQPLADSQLEDIVRRSWRYVAIYNVNDKGAMQYKLGAAQGGETVNVQADATLNSAWSC